MQAACAAAVGRSSRLAGPGDHLRGGTRLRESLCRRRNAGSNWKARISAGAFTASGMAAALSRSASSRLIRVNGAGGRARIATIPGLTGAGKFRAVAWSDAELAAESESPRLRAQQRKRACAALRRRHAILPDGRHLARRVDLEAAVQRHARGRGLRACRRHQLRRGGGLAQTPGLQLHLVHRRVSELGRRRTRRHLRQQGRRVSAQCLGEVRPLGAEREDLHGRRRDHHRQGHARRSRATGPSKCSPIAKGSRTSIASIRNISRASIARCGTSSDQGFVPFLETIRRDNAPSWKRYFDFNESYARFVQYLVARYGAYNLDVQRHSSRLDSEGFQPHGR